jgi:hypothetical protein
MGEKNNLFFGGRHSAIMDIVEYRVVEQHLKPSQSSRNINEAL